MVRGILKNGAVQPIDPLPPHWREGQLISMEEESHPMNDPAEIARWVEEMNACDSGATAEDTAVVLRAVNQHRAEQKELMRKRMGLA